MIMIAGSAQCWLASHPGTLPMPSPRRNWLIGPSDGLYMTLHTTEIATMLLTYGRKNNTRRKFFK
ncbi:hypothetical protein D3C81_1953400 [compost metagenome]